MSLEIPQELKEEAKKIEEEESKIFTQKLAIYHEKTEAGVKDGKIVPHITMSAIMYIDENENELIDKNGKTYPKNRVARYGTKDDNPEYDVAAIVKEDVPGLVFGDEDLERLP